MLEGKVDPDFRGNGEKKDGLISHHFPVVDQIARNLYITPDLDEYYSTRVLKGYR